MTDKQALAAPRLAICVPTFRDDATRLIGALGALKEAPDCALLIYDDGSGEPALVQAHEAAVQRYPGPKMLYVAPENAGRSFARNWLVTHAPANWVLLIDADMLPDSPAFLARYLQAIEASAAPSLIVGGFSVRQITPSAGRQLHHAQALASDCVPADVRRQDPGRYVFSSNILAHRDVFADVPFDEGYNGWGWEDVDWGLRVSDTFPVTHIDNTATHLGLEDDAALIRKFGTSGPNFARLAARHPGAASRMPLLAAARRVKGIPFLASISRALAAATFLPLRWRVIALKLYRAASYAPYIEPAK